MTEDLATSKYGSRRRSPRRGRSHAQRSGETRARVLEAAVQCIAEDGFQRTHLAEIASRAGVSVGAIQHQFSDKAGVLAAVVAHGFDALVSEVVRLPADSGELPGRVARLVEATWTHYAQPQSRAALEIALQMRSDPEFQSVSAPHLAQIRGAIDRMWMGFFWDLEASRGQHVRAQRLLFTTLNGLIVESMLIPMRTDASRDLETLADSIVRILAPEA